MLFEGLASWLIECWWTCLFSWRSVCIYEHAAWRLITWLVESVAADQTKQERLCVRFVCFNKGMCAFSFVKLSSFNSLTCHVFIRLYGTYYEYSLGIEIENRFQLRTDNILESELVSFASKLINSSYQCPSMWCWNERQNSSARAAQPAHRWQQLIDKQRW